MRTRKKMTALLGAALLIGSAGAVASADDGDRVSKSMSHDGSITGNTVPENEHAFVKTMDFYVPTQRANGTVEPVEYYNVDGTLVETRAGAKPLVGVYINGEAEHVDGVGFVGHGARDAYAAVSLDDGETYKNTNLSESADEASSDVIRKDIKLFKDTKGEYPGDVVNIFHAVAGDKVVVAWPSRYCSSGQPNYSLDSEEAVERRAAIASYLGIDLATASPDDLYLVDMYRVAGQQGSVDYAADKWEQNQAVGEVPYSCVWTARGQLVDGDDPRTESIEETYLRWFKAERLTSGRRDANRIEVKGVAGAGFAITWQEDPDGLRPGQGEGPGEGWSGAIGNSQTDVWYSYVDWEDVDVVQDPAVEDGTKYLSFEAYTTAAMGDITQKPKPFVPFSMPMPITDNAKCNVENPAPYCWGSALQVDGVPAPTDSLGNVLDPLAYGMKDMCAATVDIPTGRDGTLSAVCVPNNADGTQAVPLVGNTAATRARLNLFGYDSNADGSTDSAFVVVQLEEDKGLGRALYDPAVDENGVPTGLPSETPCTSEDEKECIAWDIGKNQWYHTFSMQLTDDLAVDPVDGLVANLTFHGHMLNQPEIDWSTGEWVPELDTSVALQYGDYGFPLYNTEIARRGSMLAQGISAAQGSTSGLIALPTWKQGQMNQGGPADVMSRRIVLPDGWTLAGGNPYAFRNLACAEENLMFADGSNPYYPGGVCLESAINMSATIPETAIDSATGADVDLPVIGTDGSSDTSPFLRGVVQGEGDTTKVLTWFQDPVNFTDQSWYNPYEVAKGHRGFLDGDFVMMLYAWSPNWRLNAVGHDRYELYIRRSFDGAGTWTTTPSALGGDGTVTCETYRTAEQQQQGDSLEPRVCTTYGAGEFEQARNVTQHQSMRITTLDPRYAKTAASITDDPYGSGYALTDEDTRDPSRYFIVFETGDNTTTAEGEPEPLDLFYSRAVNYGDDYQVWAEEDDLSVCYPSDPHGDDKVVDALVGTGFCNEFDQLEQGKPGLEASEASLAANPGGEFMYAAWAQALVDDSKVKDKDKKDKSVLVESDAMVRRVWWIDGYTSQTEAWDFGQGPGGDG